MAFYWTLVRQTALPNSAKGSVLREAIHHLQDLSRDVFGGVSLVKPGIPPVLPMLVIRQSF